MPERVTGSRRPRPACLRHTRHDDSGTAVIVLLNHMDPNSGLTYTLSRQHSGPKMKIDLRSILTCYSERAPPYPHALYVKRHARLRGHAHSLSLSLAQCKCNAHHTVNRSDKDTMFTVPYSTCTRHRSTHVHVRLIRLTLCSYWMVHC